MRVASERNVRGHGRAGQGREESSPMKAEKKRNIVDADDTMWLQTRSRVIRDSKSQSQELENHEHTHEKE
jgi:hypothetical protein